MPTEFISTRKQFPKPGLDVVVSHVRECDGAVQTNEEHTRGVARLAEAYAEHFGVGVLARVSGLLHDKGKERKTFQAYIRTITGLDADANWHNEDKTHAYIGAIMAYEMCGMWKEFVSFPIMGHHVGLPDYTDFEESRRKPIPPEVEKPQKYDLPGPETLIARYDDFKDFQRDAHHLTRVLYSCLVDADYLDTEAFMNPSQASLRGLARPLVELKPMLDTYLDNLSSGAPRTPVNELRSEILNQCRAMAKSPAGFFSLTVPTGGGKTLSSLAWAIEHALANGKKRVVIAIPYTSIVTQTAQILGDIFGEGNVLEHHSNFDPEGVRDENVRDRFRLATENWDYPIVVTTNVQLFESMMSNRPSRCRKLHNLADSVLILDEVQTLPLNHWKPVVNALKAYNSLFGMSVLFTTASQPALSGDICWGHSSLQKLQGIANITEIIPADWKLHDKLRRVGIQWIDDKEALAPADIAGKMAECGQALCIVNSRAQAKEVYDALPAEGRMHLSRMMCSVHLKRTIADLKDRLKDPRSTVRVVSTSLIEAGVDIDFPVVFRQEAGLDSVLQAAGRCNREGRRDPANSHAYVFRLVKKPAGQLGSDCDSWADIDTDLLAPATMRTYFINRYSRQFSFDTADIATKLEKAPYWQFETAAKDFKMIDNDGYAPVIVNYGDSPSLISQLRSSGPAYALMKKLGLYTVNLRQSDFNKLLGAGLIEEIAPGIFYVPDAKQYKEDVGLCVESHWLDEILVVDTET